MRTYNTSVHSDIGTTPLERYQQTRSAIRMPKSKEWLEECFLNRITRKVNKDSTGWYEAEINGRGTYFHILAGRHKYGNYLYIPNHDVRCGLSNIFWNEERTGSLMRKVDAVTVATGLIHLPVLADKQGKN